MDLLNDGAGQRVVGREKRRQRIRAKHFGVHNFEARVGQRLAARKLDFRSQRDGDALSAKAYLPSLGGVSLFGSRNVDNLNRVSLQWPRDRWSSEKTLDFVLERSFGDDRNIDVDVLGVPDAPKEEPEVTPALQREERLVFAL